MCRGYIGWVPCYCCRQLRFSLYSRAVTIKTLSTVVFLYYLLVLALWSILCLMPSWLVSCSVVGCCSPYSLVFSLRNSACPVVLCLIQLSMSKDLGFCSLFYPVHFPDALWDSLSRLVHSGIACLASQAPDWAVAFWDGLSGL